MSLDIEEVFSEQLQAVREATRRIGFVEMNVIASEAVFGNESGWFIMFRRSDPRDWEYPDIYVYRDRHELFSVKQIFLRLEGRNAKSLKDQLDILISRTNDIFIRPNEYESFCRELNEVILFDGHLIPK